MAMLNVGKNNSKVLAEIYQVHSSDKQAPGGSLELCILHTETVLIYFAMKKLP